MYIIIFNNNIILNNIIIIFNNNIILNDIIIFNNNIIFKLYNSMKILYLNYIIYIK